MCYDRVSRGSIECCLSRLLANTRPGLYATRESAHLGAARERPVERGEALEEVQGRPSEAERRDRHRRHLESVECTSGVMRWSVNGPWIIS